VADAGFWNTDRIARLTGRGIRTLVSPDAGNRKTSGLTRQRRKHYLEMRDQSATDEGKALYRQRQAIIEPVFAQTKHNRRIDCFHRRGLWACRAEWRLITATHNLLKLWRTTWRPIPDSRPGSQPRSESIRIAGRAVRTAWVKVDMDCASGCTVRPPPRSCSTEIYETASQIRSEERKCARLKVVADRAKANDGVAVHRQIVEAAVSGPNRCRSSGKRNFARVGWMKSRTLSDPGALMPYLRLPVFAERNSAASPVARFANTEPARFDRALWPVALILCCGAHAVPLL
jgi:Transposase DDE domain